MFIINDTYNYTYLTISCARPNSCTIKHYYFYSSEKAYFTSVIGFKTKKNFTKSLDNFSIDIFCNSIHISPDDKCM